MWIAVGISLVALTTGVALFRWYDCNESRQWLGVVVGVWGGFTFRSLDSEPGRTWMGVVYLAVASPVIVSSLWAFRDCWHCRHGGDGHSVEQ